MIEIRIARRYLWAARKQAHTAFLSLISMLGLAIGVFVLIISLALLSGLQGQIKERLITSSPQLLVEPIGKNTIDDAEVIVAEGRKMGMKEVHAIVSGIGWGGNEAERRGRPVRIRSGTLKVQLSSSEIAVARDVAAGLALSTGDDITIVAPRTRLTPFGPVPVFRKYKIAQLLPPAVDDRYAEAALDMDEAERLFGTNGPTSIEMYGDAALAESMQTKLAAEFSSVQVKTWKEINRPLFLALRLEKVVMFASIALIIFVAALNLISSLSMLIMEKRPGVGVLRTLGATDRTILTIFMEVGLLIGLTGTLLGDIGGLTVALSANRWHLVPLPRDIYFIRYLPFQVNSSDFIGVNVVAVLLSIFATWYPARMAAKLDPIAAIKEEA
jgi:lipoprotein-releasing system permease protein